jgi:hypothetical protein
MAEKILGIRDRVGSNTDELIRRFGRRAGATGGGPGTPTSAQTFTGPFGPILKLLNGIGQGGGRVGMFTKLFGGLNNKLGGGTNG